MLVLAARIEVLSLALQEAVRVLSAPQGAAFVNSLRVRLQTAGECDGADGTREEADAAAAGELRRLLIAVGYV
jgi:hypothetical protein